MKNLKLLSSFVAENDILSGSECFCVGSVKGPDSLGGYEKKEFCDNIYVYCNRKVYCLGDNGKKCNELYNLENYYNTPNTDYRSVGIEYNRINDSIILALKNGDIFSLEWQRKEIDCIGSVDSGLKALGISPDLEVIVLATGGDTVILMDGLFNPIIEVILKSNEPVEKQMVNVGWGKKETQFHGSEGKAARTKTIADDSNLNVDDDHCTRITWREDSDLFAISFWSVEEDRRKIKIYNNQGKLQCNNELLPGLEQTISWRPSGNLIAFGQTFPNKHVIGFLEKNGLRHGEFLLPEGTEVKEICWNINSTIMCIVGEKSFQLWTMNNYHWYLKQQVNFPNCCKIVSVKWHPDSNNKLLLLLSNGLFYSYCWMSTVDRSSAILNDDKACVAVIDGQQVLLTCFKQAIIPPPMSTYTLNFDYPINAVAFLQEASTKPPEKSFEPCLNDFIVYLSDGTMKLVHLGLSAPTIKPLNMSITFKKFINTRHLLWISPQTLVFCVDSSKSCDLYKLEMNFDDEISLSLCSSIQLDFSLRTMCCSRKDNLLIHADDGSVYSCKDLSGTSFSKVFDDVLEHLCDEMDVIEGKKKGTIVTLDSWNHMFCQGQLITTKATSYFIQPPYLIFTTDEHELFFYKVCDTGALKRVSSRRLERGARIVTVFNDTVVLQLPRGNLETIQPRALVLNTVANFLEKLEYKEAFALMRRQRIHMNLFIDHHPQVFLLTAAKFIQRINDPNHLNIFLSELIDKEDVTTTIYKDFYDQEKRPNLLNKKLKTVCSSLREAMIQTEDTKYLLPILTTHVRMDEMSDALKIASTSNQALRHLIFLADVDRLYDKAISLYELDLALKIAAESKKDPKEYLPYLNNLKNLDPFFMRFIIDCQYKNYESALRNISKSADDAHFDEALDLIQKTALYPLALDLYRENLQRYRVIAGRYGVFLMEKKCFEEAAVMLMRSGDLEKSLNSFVKCGLWRDALSLARKMNYSEELCRSVGERAFEALAGLERWSEAAELAELELQQPERAVQCLLEAKLYSKAIYLAMRYPEQNTNFNETDLVQCLTATANSLLSRVEQEWNELERFSTRLAHVREKKAQKKENLFGDIDVNDLQSEVSSSSSSWSSRSGGSHSSKSSRKAQRNLWSLREGNPREEMSLLLRITESIERIEKMSSDVKPTCLQLVRIDNAECDRLAHQLQKVLASTLDRLPPLKKSVWPLQPGSSEESVSTELADAKLKFPPVPCVSRGWKIDMLEYESAS